MWNGQPGRLLPVEEPAAELGEVTLGGNPAGVVLGGERRQLPVYGPGGYLWRPTVGEQVLVLKAGAERESPSIVGRLQESGELEPGEVRLKGGNSEVWLQGDELALRGNVTVNGTGLVDLIVQVVIDLLSDMEGEGWNGSW